MKVGGAFMLFLFDSYSFHTRVLLCITRNWLVVCLVFRAAPYFYTTGGSNSPLQRQADPAPYFPEPHASILTKTESGLHHLCY